MPDRFEMIGSRGLVLAAEAHRPAGWRPGGPAVILCHGMLSHKGSAKHVSIAEAAAGLGLLAVRFDFAGRGDSGGALADLTISGQVMDLSCVVSRVKDMGAGRLSLVGASLGGTVSVLYAGRQGGVECVAAMAAVSRPAGLFVDLLGAGQVDRWKRTGVLDTGEGPLGWGFAEDARQQDVLGAASMLRCPALFVHGSLDSTVPWQSSCDLASAAGSLARVQIVEGADHRFSEPVHLSALRTLIVDFLSRHSGVERAGGK